MHTAGGQETHATWHDGCSHPSNGTPGCSGAETYTDAAAAARTSTAGHSVVAACSISHLRTRRQASAESVERSAVALYCGRQWASTSCRQKQEQSQPLKENPHGGTFPISRRGGPGLPPQQQPELPTQTA